MRRYVLVVFTALLFVPASAWAQIHQVSSSSNDGGKVTVNFSVGLFALQGLTSRPVNDILYQDLQPPQPLLFNVSDLNSVPWGGEFLYGINKHIEVGAGLTYSAKTANSVYANLTNPDNSEINQALKLHQTTEAFTGRYLFLPRGSALEPYIGAGIVAIHYSYSETGEFVDLTDLSTFNAQYETSGTTAGPLVLGGVRGRLGGGKFVVGGEARWQHAVANVPVSDGFLGTQLSLTGWTYNFTFGVRF